jgi:hypothetical protein
MAYADDVAGPWKVHAPGVLGLAGTLCDDTHPEQADKKHMASPDVHVVDATREIRMYFHCPAYVSGPRESRDSYSQSTLLALSKDGLHFDVRKDILGPAYFRVFSWQGATYAIDPSRLFRSEDGLTDFVPGPELLRQAARHGAVTLRGSTLFLFYTQVGDQPERILLSTVDLTPPWREWRATTPVTVLEPTETWEGAGLPLAPSSKGIARTPLRQLRDPAIFEEGDSTWLLYSVAGESGIAIARLRFP